MKKTLYTLFLISLLATVAQSCRERPINGELDAQWQIIHILYSNGHESVPDEPRRYVSFYRHTIQLAPGSKFSLTGNMAYDEKSSTIAVEFPFWNDDFTLWGFDTPPAQSPNPYTTTLKVEQLSSSWLTLVTPQGSVITLRKY